MSILQDYYQDTVQEINWDKSSFHFSQIVTRVEKGGLCHLLDMKECTHHGIYLGDLLCKYKHKAEAYGKVVARLANKLSRWKARALSIVSLVKLVSQGIPSFVMQIVDFPTSIARKLDNMI